MNRTNKFINKSIQLAIAPLLATGILFPLISSNTANVTNNITSTEESYSYQIYENDPLPGFGFTYENTDYYVEWNKEGESDFDKYINIHILGDETKTFGEVYNFTYEWTDYSSGPQNLIINFDYRFNNYLPTIDLDTDETIVGLFPGEQRDYYHKEYFTPILYNKSLGNNNSFIKLTGTSRDLGQFVYTEIDGERGYYEIPSEKSPWWGEGSVKKYFDYEDKFGDDPTEEVIAERNTYNINLKIDFKSMLNPYVDFPEHLDEDEVAELKSQINMIRASWREFYFSFSYYKRVDTDGYWSPSDPEYDNISLIFNKINEFMGAKNFVSLNFYWHQFSSPNEYGMGDQFTEIENVNFDRGAYVDNLDDKYPTIDPIEPDKPVNPEESKDNRIWIWAGTSLIILIIGGSIIAAVLFKNNKGKEKK